MWREIDSRTPERDRTERHRGSRAGTEVVPNDFDDHRSALTRDLELPRGKGRERVHTRHQE